MRYWFTAFALLVALWGAPAKAQIAGPVYCNQMATAVLPLATKTQVVAAIPSGTSQIYVCGYTVTAVAAASTITFQYGTGTNCATGSTAIGPLVSLSNTGVSVAADNSPTFRGLIVPDPNALCATAATAAANITIFYSYGN
jgi:hypothetical protein